LIDTYESHETDTRTKCSVAGVTCKVHGTAAKKKRCQYTPDTIFQTMNEAKEADEQAAIMLCHLCGQPPRKTESGTLIPLKKCSRCQLAWYHDAECQKRHYSIHKTMCRLIADVRVVSARVTNPTETRRALLEGTRNVRVQAKQGRGRCLVASAPIQRHGQISPEGGTSTWEALVPPVLLESQRCTRCALCFGKLTEEPFRYDEIPFRGDDDPYMVLFCSLECLTTGREYGFDREEVIAMMLCKSTGQPPKIFDSAIFLSRLLRAGPEILNDLMSLQCKRPDGTSPSNERDEETRQVLFVAGAMGTQNNPATADSAATSRQMREILDRIKINAFRICDAQSVHMGIGIFSLPSLMNHSCEPNITQTFFSDVIIGRPPSI